MFKIDKIRFFILDLFKGASFISFGIKQGISFLDCLPVVVDKQGVVVGIVVGNRMVDSGLRVEHKLWQLQRLEP